MMVVVQATNEFKDYTVFLRAMGVVLSGMSQDDNELAIYAVGSKDSKVAEFAMEFCNVSEKGMKLRGKKISMYKTTDAWINEYLTQMNYFAFFSNTKQSTSVLAKKAKEQGVELGIFQY
jgi:hypothetical protein